MDDFIDAIQKCIRLDSEHRADPDALDYYQGLRADLQIERDEAREEVQAAFDKLLDDKLRDEKFRAKLLESLGPYVVKKPMGFGGPL